MGQIADIYQRWGTYSEALRIRLEEQLPVYEKLNDVRLRAVTMGQIADIYEIRGKLDEALRIQQEQLPVFEKLGDARDRAFTMGKIAGIYQRRGKLNEALRMYTESLAEMQRLQDVRSCAYLSYQIALVLTKKKRPAEALEICQKQALPLSVRLKDREFISMVLSRIAKLLVRLGRAKEAAAIRKNPKKYVRDCSSQ